MLCGGLLPQLCWQEPCSALWAIVAFPASLGDVALLLQEHEIFAASLLSPALYLGLISSAVCGPFGSLGRAPDGEAQRMSAGIAIILEMLCWPCLPADFKS